MALLVEAPRLLVKKMYICHELPDRAARFAQLASRGQGLDSQNGRLRNLTGPEGGVGAAQLIPSQREAMPCRNSSIRPVLVNRRLTLRRHDIFPFLVMKSKSQPSSACKTLALKRCA